MTSPDTTTSTYEERRERDWNDFTSRRGALPDYWQLWEERSFGWKVPIVFLQPVGLDAPSAFEPLQALLSELDQIVEVEVPPVPWLHIHYVHVGFLRAVDVLWSQVESFYVNAAPRIRRVEPFSVRLRGISVGDDERIYLGVEDSGQYREVRRQIRLGVPKVHEAMKDDPSMTAEGDTYMPSVDIGYFTGQGERQQVIEALERYRDVDLGEVALTHMKMARMPIQPHAHYEDIDVIAEIPLLGAEHRKGYHN
ncbi:MAG: hypothetical protein GEU80_11385 [Dehalococcoidia bacterium]|nr:hypothetical protein [Dehalococcoidia bacterium]